MSQTGIILNTDNIIDTLTGDTGGPVGPELGDIDIFGGLNVNTVGDAIAHSITINLDTSIQLPSTNAAGDEGVIALGATALPGGYITDRFLHNYGTNNTFLGYQSGNMTLTGETNTGFGTQALVALTTASNNAFFGYRGGASVTEGEGNTGVGVISLSTLTTGGANVGLGTSTLMNLVTGSYNIAVGASTGVNYLGAESSNILIGNLGGVGESNTIRVGTQGIGAGEQDTTYIAGIYQGAGVAEVVLVDADGQLGSSTGNDGEILIGQTGGAPAWGAITSTGATIAVTLGANTINLETVAPAATQYDADAGNAVPAAGVITMAGGTNINTSGAGSTVTYNLDTSIQLPSTNVAGDEGVIALGATALPGGYVTDRFVHNYGTENAFVGYQAGALDAGFTASFSTAIGYQAMNANATGDGNTMVGHTAGTVITSAAHSVGVGEASLTSLTIGQENTAIGSGSLAFLVSGDSNVALGRDVGSAYTTNESDNILIGVNVGVIGDNNTLRIGGQGTGTGQQDTAYIGGIYQGAGATQTVMIDADGLLGSTTAIPLTTSGSSTDNAVVRWNGTSGNSIQDSSVIIDDSDNVTGINDCDIDGILNLNAATSSTAGHIELNSTRFVHAQGTRNTFIGEGSGNFTLTGTDNTAIGYGVLPVLTTGINCTAIGSQALAVNTGTSNTAVGAFSLQSNVSGGGNTGIGRSSLNTCTGSGNTAIGIEALNGVTSGNFNTGIGRLSLYTSVTTGSYNTCIGYTSGQSLGATDSSNILISHDGVSGDNNTLRIGTQGTGNAQQDTTYIAGIYQGSATAEVVFVDADGEIGSSTGSNGQVIIGQTGGAPAWGTLTAADNIEITNAANSITIGNQGYFLVNAYSDVDSSPYVVGAAEYFLSVNTSAATRTIQLPNAPTTRRAFVIKDRSGNASSFNITVTTVGGSVTIDGSTSQTISSDYASFNVVFNGTSYEIY